MRRRYSSRNTQKPGRRLRRLLDGSRDIATLVNAVADQILAGKLVVRVGYNFPRRGPARRNS